MRKHRKLTGSLKVVEGDVIRPLRTGRRRPGREEVHALADRPRWEIETLLEEKEHEASSPGWGHLMSLVGVFSAAFSPVCALLIAFAGFMAEDPRLQTKLTVQDAGQTYVEVMWMLCGLAALLVISYGVLSFRANLYRNRCIEWSIAAKSALRLMGERSDAQNPPTLKHFWSRLTRRP